MDFKMFTVKDIYELCQGNCLLQVESGYNGKVLCKNYKPEKHGKISDRVVYDIRPACKVQGGIWCLAYLVVSVNGSEEYEENNVKRSCRMDKQIDKDINVRSKMIEEMAEYIFGNAITHDTQFKEDCRSIARDLICVGYRKIPEGAVVVSEDEYTQLVVKSMDNFSSARVEACKETAEKFAERVKMAFYYEFDELIPSIMADKIDEICKEITEGDK